MKLTVVTATTGTPVSLDEAKAHLYVTTNDKDADINRKVKAATRFCQGRIAGHRQFMKATYDGVMPGFPHDQRITFPLPPLQSITSIKYFNSTGGEVSSTSATSTFSSTDWNTVTPTEAPGFIEPVFGKVWPVTQPRIDAVTTRFVAGSTSVVDVPENIKAAVLLVVGHLWRNREAVVTGVNATELQMSVDDLLNVSDYGFYG